MECRLGKGELMRLAAGQSGLVVRSLRGTLWLTTGNGMDYLIYQGCCFSLGAGVPALVEGLDSAEMRLEDASSHGASVGPVSLHQACPAFL